MGITVVDTNEKFAGFLHNIFGTAEGERKLNVDVNDTTCSDIAQSTIDNCENDKERRIFINIDGTFKSKRQQQKGVEILMWLRCKHRISNPVILYSFQSSHQLLKQKPENLIISSEGCYLFQLPYDFEKIHSITFEGVKDEKSLKKFLKPAFSIEEFRHKEANWWGIKCLWDVYQIFIKNETDYEYIGLVESKFNDLLSVIGVFNHDNKQSLTSKRDEIQNSMNSIKGMINSLLSAIPENEFKRDYYNLEILELDTYLRDLKSSIENSSASLFLNTLSEQYQELSDRLNALIAEKETSEKLLSSERTDIELLQQKLCNKKELIEEIVNIDDLKRIPYDVVDKISTTKILLIDDQYEEGWKEVYSHIFYGNAGLENFRAVKSVDEIDFSCAQSLLKGETFLPDLILLDLRLKPDEDQAVSRQFKDLSGAKLLSKLRNKHSGIPVLMTTASNKVWSFEELMRLGADAYWMKEGIDNSFTADETIQNYIKLVWLIEKLTDDKYLTLKDFAGWIENFDYTNAWWNKVKLNRWATCTLINGSESEIKQLFHQTVIHIRSYLHYFHLGYGVNDLPGKISEAYSVTNLINKLGNTVEIIHDYSAYDYKSKTSKDFSILLSIREDKRGNAIRETRNRSSHREYHEANWEALAELIKAIKEYFDQEFISPDKCDSSKEYNDKIIIRKSKIVKQTVEVPSEILKDNQTKTLIGCFNEHTTIDEPFLVIQLKNTTDYVRIKLSKAYKPGGSTFKKVEKNLERLIAVRKECSIRQLGEEFIINDVTNLISSL